MAKNGKRFSASLESRERVAHLNAIHAGVFDTEQGKELLKIWEKEILFCHNTGQTEFDRGVFEGYRRLILDVMLRTKAGRKAENV